MNFVPRGGWHISFLAEDAKTPIGKPFRVRDINALLRIVAKLNFDETRVRTTILNWGQGSEWIDPTPAQCKFLGIATNAKDVPK